MGNYDGSIKMNTKIETKDLNSQMLSVANAIKKSEDEIVRLNARMDELKNKKIPTAEYIKLQKQLKDTQRKFNHDRTRCPNRIIQQCTHRNRP